MWIVGHSLCSTSIPPTSILFLLPFHFEIFILSPHVFHTCLTLMFKAHQKYLQLAIPLHVS